MSIAEHITVTHLTVTHLTDAPQGTESASEVTEPTAAAEA